MRQKTTFLILLSCIILTDLSAQTFDLNTYNTKRLKMNHTAMTVLGGWAIGNLAFSGIQWGRTKGENRAFHQMNVVWNAVNLGIAIPGFFGSRKAQVLDAPGSIRAQHQVETVFLLNAGIDFAYIGTGAWLWEHGNNTVKNSDRNIGWGKSLVLQGGFLLAFDWVNYPIHKHHGKQLDKQLPTFFTSGNGIGLVYRW